MWLQVKFDFHFFIINLLIFPTFVLGKSAENAKIDNCFMCRISI